MTTVEKLDYTTENIARLVLEYQCYQTVADMFDKSRQHIAAVAKRAGLPPISQMKAARNTKLLEAAKTKTPEALALEFKMRIETVNAILRKAGVQPVVASDGFYMANAVAEVAKKRSIRAVAAEYDISAETLRRYCKKANVVSTHGRWHKGQQQ